MELREVFKSDFLVEEISEGESKTVLARLKYPFIKGDTENLNRRTYPSRILKREIEKMRTRIAVSAVPGMLNHPISGSTELDKISHLISDVSWLESERKGIAVSSILRTTKGKDLLVLLKSDLRLGASVRGFGNVSASGEVQDDYRLESIDFVLGPSFGKDVQIDKSNLIESGNAALLSLDYKDSFQWAKSQEKKSPLKEDLRLKYQFARECGARLTFADFLKSIKEK